MKKLGSMTQRETAYHEAAHAVADVRFGFGCSNVTIMPDRETRGCATPYDAGIHQLTVVSFEGAEELVEDLDPEKAEKLIIAMLAGYIAHGWTPNRRNTPKQRKRARLGADADFKSARGVLYDMDASDPDEMGRRRTLIPYLKLTRQFVRKEWSAIEAVAKELLQRQKLDGDEVETIIAIVDGEATTEDLALYRQLKEGKLKKAD